MLRPSILLLPAAGMDIRSGTAAELPEIALFPVGYILPVAIPVADIDVLLALQKLADLIALMLKDQVGMVVLFVGPVRSNDWSGTEDELEHSRGLFQGLEQPLLLLFAENRLLGTVRQVIATTVVASLQEPDL